MIRSSIYSLALLLCCSLAVGNKSAHNHEQLRLLVTDLPGLQSNIDQNDVPLMYSGQIELYHENNTHYYFWKHLDKDKVKRNRKRTTFWFNGGPGCSSMDGALMELGAFRVNSKNELIYNEGSWHRLTDMVFVDQPGGTGFSTTDKIDHGLDRVALDFMRFLEKYFELFPTELDNDIYLSGESYAGQYIPYIASKILDHNDRSNVTYNLKGLLIGNGWISPNEQAQLYLPFAVKSGIITKDNPSMPAILQQQQKCQEIVSKIDAATASDQSPQLHDFESESRECESILNQIIRATADFSGAKDQQCINIYDVRLRDESPACGMSWPPDLPHVYKFLRDPTALQGLHIPHQKEWKECSREVSVELKARNSITLIHLFARILQQVPILLFHGDRDLICNSEGVLSMIKKLSWGGHTGFSHDLEKVEWKHANSSAGYLLSERNLTFVSVYNASHMVPYDKPDVSRALIDLMTHEYDIVSRKDGKHFVTHPLRLRNDSHSVPDPDRNTSNRVTRVIQFAVILVLLWGIHVLYSAYRARPSSIIKSSTVQNTDPSSQPKKNVQWAENLRRFQLEEQLINQNTSFFQKFIKKLKGLDQRGNYTPPRTFSPEFSRQSFELDGLASHVEGDDFIIGSDEELDDERSEQDRLNRTMA